MAFSISDFNDLIQLLNSNPQLRDELRRALFTEEFVNLPQAVQELARAQQAMAEAIAALSAEVKELAEAQKRTETRIEELAEAQKRTETRIEELAEAQKRTETRIEELAGALTETQRIVAELAELYKLLSKDVAMLKGFMLEQRYRLNPGAFFWREYRKLRVLNLTDLDRVDEAYARGVFSPKEWKALNKLDLLLLGVTGKGDERREEYLAVEISWVVDVYDVERAHQRAELLRRLGYSVRAAVGGSAILDDAKARASALGVIVALNSDDDKDDEEA
jgi:prefoldin subunit 5